MEDHIKIVAILHIIAGAFGILVGFIVLFVMGGLTFVVGMSVETQEFEYVGPIMMLAGLIFSSFVFLTSLPGIIGGFGLLKYENWARILIIIISILYIPFHFPLGTILGIYSLWVLFSKESESIFNQSEPGIDSS